MGAFHFIHRQVAATRPALCFVWGERNSGTNLVRELLRRNFPALADSPGDQIGQFGFPYGWKHGFPGMIAAPDTTLAVIVVRDPETWVRAMHARPWHVMPDLAKRPFGDFIRAEWRTRIDEQNFGVLRDDPRWGAELQYDRHPLTGARFANIAQLRNAKLAAHLALSNRFANCLITRHEDVSPAQEQFVAAVSDAYQLPRYRQFRPIESRRGRAQDGPFKPTVHAPLDPVDHDFLWSELDPAQEARLGYDP